MNRLWSPQTDQSPAFSSATTEQHPDARQHRTLRMFPPHFKTFEKYVRLKFITRAVHASIYECYDTRCIMGDCLPCGMFSRSGCMGVWKRWDFYFLRQLKENAVYVLEWIAQEKKENKRSKRCVEVKEIDSKTATCRGPLTTAPATSLISPCIRVALCHL